MTRLTPLIFTASLLVGCVAHRSIDEGQPCPCAPGWSCDTPNNVCVTGAGGSATAGVAGTSGGSAGSLGTGGSLGTAGMTGGGPACSATCTTPAGTVQPLTSVADVYATIAGSWQICAGGADWHGFGQPADVIGVEFGPASAAPQNGTTVGGNMYYLVAGPSGPVRGSGFAYQLTYDALMDGQSIQLDMHPQPNSGFGANVRYSPCPMELELTLMYMADPAILVRFGSDWTTPDAATDGGP